MPRWIKVLLWAILVVLVVSVAWLISELPA